MEFQSNDDKQRLTIHAVATRHEGEGNDRERKRKEELVVVLVGARGGEREYGKGNEKTRMGPLALARYYYHYCVSANNQPAHTRPKSFLYSPSDPGLLLRLLRVHANNNNRTQIPWFI